MKTKADELLMKGIELELEDLTTMNLSSDEKEETIDNVVKLYRLYTDGIKAENEAKIKYIGFGVDIAGFVLPLIFYAYWMNKGFEFEKTGAITSGVFKGLVNKFSPTKK